MGPYRTGSLTDWCLILSAFDDLNEALETGFASGETWTWRVDGTIKASKERTGITARRSPSWTRGVGELQGSKHLAIVPRTSRISRWIWSGVFAAKFHAPLHFFDQVSFSGQIPSLVKTYPRLVAEYYISPYVN